MDAGVAGGYEQSRQLHTTTVCTVHGPRSTASRRWAPRTGKKKKKDGEDGGRPGGGSGVFFLYLK